MKRPFAFTGMIVAAIIAAILVRLWLGMATMIVVAGLAIVALTFRVRILIWLRAKLAEWASDVKQLGLWLHLAFRRKRDAHETAAMAHQQQFLSGRIMSPMNLFAIAAVCVIGSVGAVGFEEWRIGRIKRERDAACSQRELTLNSAGRYQTSRASCSALGATLGVAAQWQTRANSIEALRNQDHARLRDESAAALVLENQRRVRANASLNRQRRRQNEAIVAALGGPAPDLERSVCELAGGVDCAGSVTARDPGAPVAADLPVGPDSAGDAPGPVNP
jgi:hypothetical protein